jgi:hypothetical protein
MAVNKVDLTISQLINDLNNGLTWLKKDDLGYGSIESKYGATAQQIMAIRKHPKLKDAETNVTIFNIIDDTNKESHSDQVIEKMNEDKKEYNMKPILDNIAPLASVKNESLDAFANL